jgi:hypothetical protein
MSSQPISDGLEVFPDGDKCVIAMKARIVHTPDGAACPITAFYDDDADLIEGDAAINDAIVNDEVNSVTFTLPDGRSVLIFVGDDFEAGVH